MTADEDEIARAVAVLRAGGLVAFPTETVYGLGADAANEAAIRRLFAAKGRPADHPVIVHLADAAQLPEWASTVPEAAKLAAAFWPGPLTLIVPRAAHVLDVVTGGQDTVGIRVPSHPVAHALLAAFGGGVVAPSANTFGHISPTRAAHVRAEFDAETVSIVLDGDPPEIGVESTIVDVSGPRPTLLRPGGIMPAQLAAVLGEPLAAPTASSPRASGTLPRHYAPHTPLKLLPKGVRYSHEWGFFREIVEQGKKLNPMPGRVVVIVRLPDTMEKIKYSNAGVEWLREANTNREIGIGFIVAPNDAEQYAQWLYQILRKADTSGASLILVEDVPEGEEWLAVRDRLRRAAQSS